MTTKRKAPKDDYVPPPHPSFDEKLRGGFYDNHAEYPAKDHPYVHLLRDAYNAESARLEALFRADMFAHYGVTGHPKADRAYAIAWERGHGNGYSEVECEFSTIVELIKP